MATLSDKQTADFKYKELCFKLYSDATVDVRKKILAYFRVERNFIESEAIQDDIQFIYKLEEKNIISDSNVEPLQKCLEALGMKRLAEIIKTYQLSTIASELANQSTQEEARELQKEDNGEFATIKSCKHQEDSNMLLCVTCCMYACYECTYTGHKDHEVFPEEEFGDEIEIYRRLVQEELKEVHGMVESFETDLNARQNSIGNDEIYHEVASINKMFHIGMQNQLQNAKKELSTLKSSREKSLNDTDRELHNLSLLSNSIAANLESKSNIPNLAHLQNLNDFKENISKGIKKAKSISEAMQDMDINVHFRPSSISAKFVYITIGQIVGSVRINENQVVIVTDQRHQDQPAIRVSCVSCDNTDHMYWSHDIESECFLGFGKKLPSVAVCNNIFITASKMYVLIGCGTKIFQVNILEPKDSCYYDSFRVKDVSLPEGSEITFLSVVLSYTHPVSLIVTDSVSHSITRLDRDLLPVENIVLGEKPHIVTGFFDQNIYAFSDGNVVKLINGNSPKYVVKTLESPKGKNTFYPAYMFHDGAGFSILWKTKSSVQEPSNKKCKVMCYSSSGDFVKISHEQDEPTCSMSNEAIGISFVKNHGLLCFSNGKVVSYFTL